MVDFKNISKSFPGVDALKNVSFTIEEGEVHAIVGENGAGKSTLIKILSGLQLMDEGEICIQGKTVELRSTRDAFSQGITCIYQELPLAPSLSISDNIFLGQERKRNGFLDTNSQNATAAEYFKEFDIDVDPRTPVEKLSVSMQQITAIIKSMMKEAKVFIMDEPTATLGEHEVDRLFTFIGKLKKKNISVIYISHRMDEIFGIADRVTVLKDGNYMGTRVVAEISKSDLIALMSGKNIHDSDLVYDEGRTVGSTTVLEVKNLHYGTVLNDISFGVKKGEIFGITGLVGAGKTELLKCMYGLLEYEKGEILFQDQAVDSDSPVFGFVPEDRKREGLFLNLDLIRNISISSLQFLSRFSYINRRKEVGLVEKHVRDLDIKTSSILQQVQFLSGGNQQKVILSRWLSSNKNVLLLDEPTRGVDVMGKTEIYKLINVLSKNGLSIVFSSSDVTEVLSISDRIAAMRNGRIVKVFERKDFNKEQLLHEIMFD